MFDQLALTEATLRAKALSLDAGRAAVTPASSAIQGGVIPTTKPPLADPLSAVPSIVINAAGEENRRITAPGIMLSGEFGFKPVEEAPENGEGEAGASQSPEGAEAGSEEAPPAPAVKRSSIG